MQLTEQMKPPHAAVTIFPLPSTVMSVPISSPWCQAVISAWTIPPALVTVMSVGW